MKRILPLLLILLLLAACGTAPAEKDPALPPETEPGTAEEPVPTPSEGPDEDELPIMPADGSFAPVDAVPATGGETVTLDGTDSYLRVDLPAGWTWAQAAGAQDGTVYGLWPEDDPDFKVELHWWPDGFGMCGTGVEFREIELADGMHATLATEVNGGYLWWTLILPPSPDQFTLQFGAEREVCEAHQAELDEILDSIRIGVLAEPQTVERPKDSF